MQRETEKLADAAKITKKSDTAAKNKLGDRLFSDAAGNDYQVI